MWAPVGACPAVLAPIAGSQTDSSCGAGSLMEDQPVKVIGDVGEDEFRLGTRDADRADEQPKAVLLMREDMLDPRADRGFGRIRPRNVLRHRLARRLAAMDAADQHLRSQPFLVLLRTIGTVGPDLGGRIVGRDQSWRHPAIGMRRRGRGTFPDKAEPPVAGDVAFVAKDWQGDLWQRLALRIEADLPADLQGPTRIDVLLSRLVGLIWPDLFRALARLDRFFLGIRVPLLRRGNERGVDDLARHRDMALLLQLPVEGLHHPPKRPGLGEFVPEQANRVLVRRRSDCAGPEGSGL